MDTEQRSGTNAHAATPLGDPARGRTPVPGTSQTTSFGQRLGEQVAAQQIHDGIKGDDTKETSEAEKNLQRRLQDEQLLSDLANNRFEGPRYRTFEEALTRYAVSVMKGWIHSGHIFRLAATRGYDIRPTEAELRALCEEPDDRDELAMMTVAVALPKFREKALVEGGWKVSLGASLTTYFMGACVFVFPNEFRKLRVERSRWNRCNEAMARVHEQHVASYERGGWRSTEPGSAVAGYTEFEDHLSSLSPREASLVTGTLAGYRQAEMMEMFGETSIRAIEGALYRWRQTSQQKLTKREG